MSLKAQTAESQHSRTPVDLQEALCSHKTGEKEGDDHPVSQISE